MRMNAKRIQAQQGLSLIELMIAITLGLFLIGGLIQLFVNSKQSYRVQENISRLQENGRFAISFLVKDVRMADYWGCLRLPSTSNLSNNLNDHATFDDYISAVAGENNNTNAGDDVIDGTDTITVKGASGAGVYIREASLSNAASFKVEDNSGLRANNIVIVSDCIEGDLFQITNKPSTGGAGFDTVIHNTDPVRSGPGNLDKPLRKIYGTDAQVFKLNFATFFIKSNPNEIPSLYKRVNGGTAIELIEGIENMQILYGEDTDDNNSPNYYVTADKVVEMNDVISIRISLLTRTIENNIAASPVPYTIFGVKTTPPAGDLIIRREFTSTVAIRNRLP
jgi:type IV pilus assembly protein PilW